MNSRQLEIVARLTELRRLERGLSWAQAEPIRTERLELKAEWEHLKCEH